MDSNSDDTETLSRIRNHLAGRGTIVEKRIVGGGIGFTVNGHLCCGLSSRGLTVRLGTDGKEAALREPHVGPLKLGEREAAAFVVVEPDGYREPEALVSWVDRGLQFVNTLA